jgi:hypothetical protein
VEATPEEALDAAYQRLRIDLESEILDQVKLRPHPRHSSSALLLNCLFAWAMAEPCAMLAKPSERAVTAGPNRLTPAPFDGFAPSAGPSRVAGAVAEAFLT